ncbi:helix-turn-helix domain-containing protein [Candidatus Woesearchaeota archaeon]|nr:helix-turn-helix domain-containing protein [Candidatus Woesearchaeota archaeon]
MDRTALTNMGLSNNEADVYLLLLEQEEALASDIAEKSKISRPHIYDTLAKLVDKGLASNIIKNNRRYFRAVNPGKLMDFLREKELSLQNIMPQLLELAKHKTKKPVVELYEGKEGLKTILNDVIKTKPREFLDWTSGKTTLVLPYFIDKWEIERAKAKVYSRFLMNDTPEGRKRGAELLKFDQCELRYLPKGMETPSHIYIYGDKLAITLWTKDFPFGILVHNKEIADRFKEFFNWFWKISNRK